MICLTKKIKIHNMEIQEEAIAKIYKIWLIILCKLMKKIHNNLVIN